MDASASCFKHEILKVALDPTVISFAGGLPNREPFFAEEIKGATDKAFSIHDGNIFQCNNKEEGAIGSASLVHWGAISLCLMPASDLA
jgi:2-aminoadipate transaminase